MNLKVLLMILALTASAAAAGRSLEMLGGAYEVDLADVRMPGSTVGSLSLRTCSSCKAIVLRVSTQTRYRLDGTAYPFDEFAPLVQAIRSDADTRAMAGIIYDLDSKLVTSITVATEPSDSEL